MRRKIFASAAAFRFARFVQSTVTVAQQPRLHRLTIDRDGRFLAGNGSDADLESANLVVEFVIERRRVVQVEVAKDRDDGLDHIRLAGAVLADDGVTFEGACGSVGVRGGASERDFEIPQVAEVGDLQSLELH